MPSRAYYCCKSMKAVVYYKWYRKILHSIENPYRFVVAVFQKNNSKSATEKYECPLIEINRYLSLQIETHTKETFQWASRYSRQLYNTWTLGSPRFGFSPLFCLLYSLPKFSFFHKLMFLMIRIFLTWIDLRGTLIRWVIKTC